MTPRQAVDRGLVSAVMQTGGLLPDITVRETVALTASLFAHRIDVDEAMERAGVADFASRTVRKVRNRICARELRLFDRVHRELRDLKKFL